MATPASFVSNAFRRKQQRKSAPRRPAIAIAPSERAQAVRGGVRSLSEAAVTPVTTVTPSEPEVTSIAPVSSDRPPVPVVAPNKKKKKK